MDFYICSMDTLNLPKYEPRIEKRDGKLVIFDPIRKKLVVLTPEEWVRQHYINYLLTELGYPKSKIRVIKRRGRPVNRLIFCSHCGEFHTLHSWVTHLLDANL